MRCASAPLPTATDVNGDYRGMLGSRDLDASDQVTVAGRFGCRDLRISQAPAAGCRSRGLAGSMEYPALDAVITPA
jgi:hypothetical protein